MRVPYRVNPLYWRNPFYWMNPYYWVPPKDAAIEARPRRLLRSLAILLHVVLVLTIVAALFYANLHFRLDAELLSPFPGLHGVWLPLLFLLLYGGAWLGHWFFRLLLDPHRGEFPDLDEAWAEGLAALDRAGIDASEVPIFLVVGKPNGSTADFFAATRLPFAVRAEPRRPEAPLRVYAIREAIFVACEGASVLARLSDLLAPAAAAAGAHAAASAPALHPMAEYGFQSVNLLDGPEGPVAVTAGDLSLPAAPGPTAGAPERPDTAAEWLPKPTLGAFAGVPTDDVDRLAARLRYIGELVSDRRRPFCPLNGIVWLLPLAGTESTALADQTTAACRADLAAVRAGFQVDCPAAAVVCDAQDLTGFRELLKGLAESSAQERLLGRSFPLAPNVPPDGRADLYLSGVTWVTRSMLPGVVYQRFGSEVEGNGVRWSESNARMWQLTAELGERRKIVARVLSQGLADDPGRPPLLAGAYFAGTGPDARDQAFAAGVVQQLIHLQNNVSWSPEADAEEADYRRMTAIGYLAMAVAAIAVGTMAYSAWWG